MADGTSSHMLRLAFEASPAAMFMVDQDGRIEMANAQCEEIFGYAPGELIGVSIDRLVPAGLRAKHKGLRSSFNANPSKRQMGVGRDLRALRRDGGVFPVEIGLTPVETPLGPRVVAFAIDVSARLATEETLKNSLAELERANESLSRFAYVASHDIQEPLRKISAFADILVSAMTSGNADEARYAAEVMATSARHARHLVADLLILARSFNDACAMEAVPVRETIQLVLDSLSQTIAEEAAEIEIHGDDFIVQGDKAQAFQLVQNLVSNAVKYHKPGQPPRVRILLKQNEAERRLAIEDEGIGFAVAHREEIFEPFRRLHNRSEIPGTGIGLAICKTIAKRHGWRLTARSTPTVGSTFEIIFADGAPATSLEA